jgi:Protein of unknown function (DUF3293)
MRTPMTESHPKEFRAAYLETVYEAGGEAFQFSPLETGIALYQGRRFTLITAANPRSAAFSDAENDARNLQMSREIEARGWHFEASLGRSPSGDWCEPGFLIWDAPLEDVLELGRGFGQNAIVYGEDGRIALAWCDDGDLEWFHARRLDTSS